MNQMFKISCLSLLCNVVVLLHTTLCSGQPLPPVPAVPENPIAGAVEALQAFAASAPTPVPTGLSAASYLETISPIVRFFLPFQNTTTGRVIDPDPSVHQEEEYSTPCFAHAAATLVNAGGNDDLLTPSILALTSSLEQLASKNCASASCDFFALPVMRTYALLESRVPQSTLDLWTASLKNISLKTWELTGQNWELTSAAGEFDRIVKRGLATGTDLNWTFWESRLGRLATVYDGGFWTADGAFNDNTGQPKISPTAYDAFGSTYVAQLLSDGYGSKNFSGGVYFDYFSPITERGVWTRASYQSPLGEQPVGGRSNQHQFAEATLAAVAEIYARVHASRGEASLACSIKRAARLYHVSIKRWIRQDGAIQILKNRFLNYTQRFGFMTYSFFSNYNLLVASWLSLAYENAGDDSIEECASLAEVGGVAFALEDPRRRKVYASASGGYMEIISGADPEFDASGFNRFHFDSCSAPGVALPCRLPSLLGPSQAPGLSGNLALSSRSTTGDNTTANGLSTGAFWSYVDDLPGTIHTLANNTLQSITAVVLTSAPSNSPSLVEFTVQYILWGEGVLVEEDYALFGGSLNATVHVSLPGQTALWKIMQEASSKRDGLRTFFSPPADPVAAQALFAGDIDAFISAVPAPSVTRVLSRLGVSFPAFRFDGTTNYSFIPPGGSPSNPDEVVVSLPDSPEQDPKDGALAFRIVDVLPGRNLTWTWNDDDESRLLSRNGLLTGVFASLDVQSASPSLSYQLEVVSVPKIVQRGRK
jgi:hypothetical protein